MTVSTNSQENVREIANMLLEIFGGNPYHARAKEIKGDITYHPADYPLSEENLTKHVEGAFTLGSYQLIQGANVVRWLGWDVDSADLEEAREMAKKIVKHLSHLPHAVEFSGRKGYHILIFLEEPMSAKDAKRIVEWVREKEGFKSVGASHVECYPKQDRLSRSRPKGNLIKIPLGEHPRTHEKSMFVDIYNGWENGPPVNPLEVLSYRAKAEDLETIVNAGPAPEEQLVDLLSDYWVEGKRHDLTLFLAGFLANEGWGFDQARDLVQALVDKTGDPEGFNRIECVNTTFARHREGMSIRGRQGLGEFLPVTTMRKLTELSSLIKAPDTVAQIDDIRYSKGMGNIESARLAGDTIWSVLNDEGDRIVQTERNLAYWYNSEDHTLLKEGTELWSTFLNKNFGLNPLDRFSKLSETELRLRIVRDAQVVPIMNRTFWAEDEKKLYINLGGPEVYIVSGKDQIEKAYNGECGYMFITEENKNYIVPDLDAPVKIDVWEHLVDDLSFTTSEEAPASPAEQKELLKAWMLAFFFQELMPTKPILALIGVPGSGKTTAIRRLLRIVEHPNADVLGVPTDKQDAFRTSIESHRLLVLDNLEKSGAWWMVDMLNKLATGNHIEVRKLYTTSEKHIIIPQCFVACTAVNIPFSDETLFSRLLVLEMEKVINPQPEHFIQRQIKEYGPAIWGDLLRKLSLVVEQIKSDAKVKAPTQSRLADFTVFCEKIKNSGVVDETNLSRGLLAMTDAQLKQLKESSQAITLLEEWINLKPEEAREWRSIPQLFNTLQTMAQARRSKFHWRSSNALYRHLFTLEERLIKEYQAEIDREFNPSSNKEEIKIRFNTVMI